MSRGLIFTADIQVEHETIDTLKGVLDEMYEYGEKHKVLGYVWLGDIKSAYNPIDGRCLNFISDQIERFRSVYILLGNHDRFGLHSNESWLTTLGKAGAHVYTEESSILVGDFALYFLPFRSSSDELRKMSDNLYERRKRNRKNPVGARCSILCFHGQLKESDVKMNAAGVLSVEDLHPKAYDYCLGGHVHHHQKVKYDHVWYVGSPFAATWGEVNQVKGFFHVEA